MFNKQGLSHKLMAKWTEIALFLLFSMRRRSSSSSSSHQLSLIRPFCSLICSSALACVYSAACAHVVCWNRWVAHFRRWLPFSPFTIHTRMLADFSMHTLFPPTSFALFFDMHFECLHHILYSIHPIQVRAISAEAISASDRITTLQQLAAENPLTLSLATLLAAFLRYFVTMLPQRIEVKWKFTKFMTFSGRLHHDNSLSFIV